MKQKNGSEQTGFSQRIFNIVWTEITQKIQLRAICIGLVMVVFLSACATTNIHLFTQSVEPVELERISVKLRSEGFNIKLNELQPPDFQSATIIYSPAHPKFSDIEEILQLLSKLGYPNILPVAVSKENNSYTGNNIGLYVGNSNPIKNAEPSVHQLPTEFAGYCQKDDASLTLSFDGNFKVKIIRWTKKEQEKEQEKIQLNGTWKRVGETIELYFADTKVQLQINDLKQIETDGLHRRIQLIANETGHTLTNCKFTHLSLEGV
ncbi:MAG: hypothetical protein L3J22_09880 [Xanthomonadales bacterium]|nr:hypothetical protein [Xanthomonadales bacterium]